MAYTRFMAFDLETVPTSESAGSWKQKREDEFPPLHTHRIVAASAAIAGEDGGFRLVEYGAHEFSEPEMIEGMVDELTKEDGTLIYSINGRGFDFPVLNHRLLNYGGDLSWFFNTHGFTHRYDASMHFDISDVFGCYHRQTGLAALAILSGLPGKGDFNGDAVLDMYNDDKLVEISLYCTSDAVQTLLVGLRMAFLMNRFTDERFQELAGSVLRDVKRDSRPEISKLAKIDSSKFWCLDK